MKEVILKTLHMENFKGYKDFTVEFSRRTRIKGMNGIGKSVIASAYMWLFFNNSYDLGSNPKVRREVEGVPVDGEVTVTAEITIDGKEITAKKIQKRKLSKKEGDNSFSDDNSYIINDVPKTLRDFNEYFGFDMTVFMLCSNVNKFLSQKTKEMREFLFGLVSSITDMEIAKKFSELTGLATLLEKYTLDEVTAMNTSSKTKLNKELSEIDPRIDQLQKSIIDIDLAEQELALSALKEQLADVEAKMLDTSKPYEEVANLKTEIADYKTKISDIENQARTTLSKKRQEHSSKLDGIAYNILRKSQQLNTAKSDAELLTQKISAWETSFEVLKKRYSDLKSTEFDQSKNICPTCAKEFEEAKKAELLEAFGVDKKAKLNQINLDGKKISEDIQTNKTKLTELNQKIEDININITSLTAEETEAKTEIAALPTEPDYSINTDYQGYKSSLSALEFSLKDTLESLTDTNTLRESLNVQKVEIQRQIEEVTKLLATKDANERAEQSIEELKESRRTLSQKTADCEKVLDMVSILSRKKNELLVEEINGKFSIVKWELFEFNKSGSYQDICIPTVDGYRFGDTTNKGREIQAKIDICQSIQRIKGISCPIWLDDAESINPSRIPNTECQLITLTVTEDSVLKIEGE